MKEFEAKLAESILAEAGIKAFLQSPDVYPPLDYKRGIKVMVLPDRAAEAKELLAEFDRDLEVEKANPHSADQL